MYCAITAGSVSRFTCGVLVLLLTMGLANLLALVCELREWSNITIDLGLLYLKFCARIYYCLSVLLPNILLVHGL